MPGVDTLTRDTPEECVEYLDLISDFIRASETEMLAEYGYMKR